jgi:hypothetical protein
MSTGEFAQRYGPIALVTGAANGIGRSFAKGLARRGLSTLLVDLDGDGLEATAQALRKEHTNPVETLVADLALPEDLERVVEAGLSREIGLLVNNAGMGHKAAFLDIDLTSHLAEIDINVRAVLVLTHHLAPPMLQRSRGGLIFTSSMSALMGTPGVAHYSSTKAYERHLAEALYGEFHGQGIDVLALMPGLTRTRQVGEKMTEEQIRALRPMEPDPVAEAALEALGRKRWVIPGARNRLQGLLRRWIPRGPVLRKMGQALPRPVSPVLGQRDGGG